MKNGKKNKPVSELPVMKACCKTCPFKLDENNQMQDAELANIVIERNFLNSQQICHGTEGKNREWKNRCRGYFDHSIEIYRRLGLDHLILNQPKN